MANKKYKFEIEHWKLDKIIPYDKNAKLHNIEWIKNSIKDFKVDQPIVVDGDGIIIKGHGRLEAAKQLKLKTFPVIVRTDLTPEQVKLSRIADNRSGEAGWDVELLETELVELENDYDLNMDEVEGLGINQDWFNELDIFQEEEMETNIKEDDYDVSFKVKAKVKLGDVYQLGNHRLMCGDSTKDMDVNILMNGNQANMVFTDPPYGVNYECSHRVRNSKVKFKKIENDNVFLVDWIPMINKYSSGFVFIWTSWSVVNIWMEKLKSIGKLTNMIIWDKGFRNMGDLKKTFSTNYEIALVFNRGNELTGKRITSTWNIIRDAGFKFIHPTQKPIALAEKAIVNTTNKNDIVLDLFGGSGSTLIACEQLGRNCYMMELDPHYCDVIIDRWEEFTSKKAVKIGKTNE